MAKTKWILDPTHSELGFKIKHLMITNVSGAFKKFDVQVEGENDNFDNAHVTATVDIGSIYTNNEQRDQHLRTSDFFEAEQFPQLTFKSTRMEKTDESYYLHGDLTMKNISKPVKLTVEFNGTTKDPWGGERAGFVITGKINRTDWGINFNGALETGGVMLSEEVKIYSEIQVVKQVKKEVVEA